MSAVSGVAISLTLLMGAAACFALARRFSGVGRVSYFLAALVGAGMIYLHELRHHFSGRAQPFEGWSPRLMLAGALMGAGVGVTIEWLARRLCAIMAWWGRWSARRGGSDHRSVVSFSYGERR